MVKCTHGVCMPEPGNDAVQMNGGVDTHEPLNLHIVIYDRSRCETFIDV